MSLDRPLALITGGTSGIGFGIACALAPKYHLALSFAQNEIKAQKALHLIRDQFPQTRVEIYRKALFNRKDCEELLGDVKGSFNANPAALVHSAGRIRDNLFLNSNFQDHVDVLNEHAVVGMALSHLCLKDMYRSRFGRVILMSSISTQFAKRGQSSYAAAKGAMEAFTKTLALEVAHRGITVNAIAPGLIETPMTEKIIERIREKTQNNFTSRIPAGYPGKAEDVGALAAFLCSPEAAYITGTTITIDGGRSLGDPES
jgi:3-oxoacyl-[acyl-carrier protein] reductase